MMRTFSVEGMTCAHCERAVTEAIYRIDPDARTAVDLSAGTVETDGRADAEQLAEAIQSAGYNAHLRLAAGARVAIEDREVILFEPISTFHNHVVVISQAVVARAA